MPFELIEIPPENAARMRTSSAYSTKRVSRCWAPQAKPHCHPRYSGKPTDTPQLAAELERWKLDGRDVSLLIGGPEGLSPACKAAAEQSWSLSALTLPHPLVRVLVAESLYRAWSITTNHPYHRE